jgi:acetyltransferase-like isoleucine patch superfamily enzyme
MTADELDRAGLLEVDTGVDISRFAVFVPADEMGELRPVTVKAGAVIEAFAVVHGGTVVEEQARVEEHTVIGMPELGYAVGRIYPGAGGTTVVGAGAVIRVGAIVYADVHIGVNTTVGHHTLLRTGVRVGTETQLGHHLTVERAASIGRYVRCAPSSHITSSTHIADRVFLGVGVRTINDKAMTMRDAFHKPVLEAPYFDRGVRVGSGTTVLAGVTIGENALVGADSLVTHDIPPGAVAYGQPARLHGQTKERPLYLTGEASPRVAG